MNWYSKMEKFDKALQKQYRRTPIGKDDRALEGYAYYAAAYYKAMAAGLLYNLDDEEATRIFNSRLEHLSRSDLEEA